MSRLVRINKDYASWIEELSQRYRRSQIKAATHVNNEMLQFYCSSGKDIVTLKAESRWGEKFITNLSSDLKAKLPEVKGLSETSIGYAKRFYLLYSKWFTIHPKLGANFRIVPFGKFLGDTINISLTNSSTLRRKLCSSFKKHSKTAGAETYY